MRIANIHEKLSEGIQQFLTNTDKKRGISYYGNFNLFINFKERKEIGTCAVNVTAGGMNFFYNSEFLNKLSQKEVNFIILHEDFHLLFDHPRRTITGQYDHKLSNIAQDMIINHIIWEDIPHTYVDIPKDENGRNMALFVPKEYTGRLIFEELYEWLRDEKEKIEKNKKSQSNQNDGGENKKEDSYGPNGKDPQNPDGTIDTYSLEHIFDNLDSNQGQYLDEHQLDEVPEDFRDSMVKDVMHRLQSRGLMMGQVEDTLNKLQKKRKDYLKYIKRSVSSLIFGNKKQETISRPNRRQIFGLKGNRKIKTKINCILDTSGSMGGTFEKVLSYIYRNDIEVNLIEADTEVRWVKEIKSKKNLESVTIKGLGGTCLQPALDYVAENFNQYNTLVLTDGYCDTLDLSRIKGNVLMISIGVEVPIAQSNGKLKQIKVELQD